MRSDAAKSIHVQYFALLREQRGLDDETVTTLAATPRQLYDELQDRHGFSVPVNVLKIAINDTFQGWETPLADDDRVVFIQPLAGG